MKPLPEPEAADLPADLFDRLLDDFGVAEDQRSAAASFLRSAITRARGDHAIDLLRKEAKRLGLEKEAAAFQAGLAKLSDGARGALGPNLHLVNQTIDAILRACADAPRPKGPLGRPRETLDSPKSTALDHLVALLYAVATEEGWRVSIEPEARTGTLVDFLKLVAPYLPADFFPPALWVDRDEYVKGSPNPWNRLKGWGTQIRKW